MEVEIGQEALGFSLYDQDRDERSPVAAPATVMKYSGLPSADVA